MKLRKIQNPGIWTLLILLLLLSFGTLVYIALRQPDVIIQQFRGEPGQPGISQQGPQGLQGRDGIPGVQGIPGAKGDTGPQGAQGVQGPAGNDGTNGTNGVDGAPSRNSEFACVNGDFVTRYEGDDAWRVLEKDSKACQKDTL